MKYKEKTETIIGAAMEVHRLLGPGFLEAIYQRALVHELHLRGFTVTTEVNVDIAYKDFPVGRHRLDLLADGLIVIELKACSAINEIHLAQALSYLKAADLELALVFNFGEVKLSWKRVIRDRIPSVSSV